MSLVFCHWAGFLISCSLTPPFQALKKKTPPPPTFNSTASSSSASSSSEEGMDMVNLEEVYKVRDWL